MKAKKLLLTSICSAALLLAGCASIRHPTDPQDPYQVINRKVFAMNEHLDKDFFEPVAKGYAKLVPKPARQGIGNVFRNLDQPSVVINDILQGDYIHAMGDTWRFVINSTFGLFGIFDIASHMKKPIAFHDNDFGLTLADWGLNDPKYVVIPLFGPSTDVDALGRLVDYYAFKPYVYIRPWALRVGTLGLYYLNRRAQLLQYSDLMKAAALDPYVFVRNAYLQRRKAELKQLKTYVHEEWSDSDDTSADADNTDVNEDNSATDSETADVKANKVESDKTQAESKNSDVKKDEIDNAKAESKK